MKNNKPKLLTTLTAYLVIGLLTIIFLEILSVSLLISNDFIRNNETLKKSLTNRVNELSTIWTVKTKYGAFDPITLIRLVPNDYYGVLPIGEHGFIQNKEEGTNFQFKKDINAKRVILLGGSSTAGSGSSNVTETISAQLEQMINKNIDQKKQKKYYEILNFGAGGGYSGAELVKFIQYLIYLEPDIVIAFDGFNDAWNAIFEKNRIGISNPIVNWSDYSYKYFESMNGLYVKQGEVDGIIPFIPFTSLAFNRVYSRASSLFSDKEAFYNDYPNYIFSKEIYKNDPFFSNVLRTNLETFASLACRGDFIFIGILQPHAYSRNEKLTQNERTLLKKFEKRYISTIKSSYNYKQLINEAFDQYSLLYKDLEESFDDCKGVKFLNIMDIFKLKVKDTYVDNIHYTPYGNQIIAKKFMNIITTLTQ